MMDRRGFLQCLGAFAAAAYLPACSERIVRAPHWWKGPVIVYRTAAPLRKGTYTFTAGAQDYGMYVGAVKALGGERLFEMPAPKDYTYEDPRIILGGIHVPESFWYQDDGAIGLPLRDVMERRWKRVRGEVVSKA